MVKKKGQMRKEAGNFGHGFTWIRFEEVFSIKNHGVFDTHAFLWMDVGMRSDLK